MDRQLLDDVLERLTQASDSSRSEEREQALIELLNVAGLRTFDHRKLLAFADQAGFWAVCEMVLEDQGRFAEIIPCLLKDQVWQRPIVLRVACRDAHG